MLSSTAPLAATPSFLLTAPSSTIIDTSSSLLDSSSSSSAVMAPSSSSYSPQQQSAEEEEEEGMSLQVTVHVAPENVDKFLAAFKPVFDKVAAEPECMFFEVYRSPEEPGKISWVENWSKSKEWFLKNQITKEYYKDYLNATEPLFIKPRETRVLERAGPEFFVCKEKQFAGKL
ncbi:hypothetical protein F5X96DRAFT_654284 [Biscogniauxia mediterranea]|nr:hypothetical protein F5X96DRAFT_654284 [Biscogniauxia mediterranea]